MKIRLVVTSLLLLALVSCKEGLSMVGESIQSPRDKVESTLRHLQFEAKTVKNDLLYLTSSTRSLLGEIYDPVYGDFKASYFTRLRWAKDFKFSYKPINGVVDSVNLLLSYTDYVGNLKLPMNYKVYEVKAGSNLDAHKNQSLESLCQDEYLLGSVYNSPNNLLTLRQVGDKSYVKMLNIKLDTKIGQRFYDKSLATSKPFNSQDSFEKEVLGGLVITTTTGKGSVLQIVNSAFIIHYSFMNDKGKKEHAQEVFISSRYTGHVNDIVNSYVENLTQKDDQFLFVKGPVGVVPELTLKKEQMQVLLDDVKMPVRLGVNWILADAQLKLEIDNPEALTLNPPSYMMLLPKDSIQNFFLNEETELTRSRTAYLSNRFNVSAKAYNFNNIAQVITKHLSKPQLEKVKGNSSEEEWAVKTDDKGRILYENVSYTQDGRLRVEKDLVLRLIPVDREVSQNQNGANATSSIRESLFPCFVRLNKSSDKLKISIVATKFTE